MIRPDRFASVWQAIQGSRFPEVSRAP
jgi:hypothetical protein